MQLGIGTSLLRLASVALLLAAVAPSNAQIVNPINPPLRSGPGPLVANQYAAYDVELTAQKNNQSIRGQLSISITQMRTGEIAGSIFGDPIQGFVDASGQGQWIRYTNNRPSQLFVGTLYLNSWYGAVHALDAVTEPKATATRNSWGFRATRQTGAGQPPALTRNLPGLGSAGTPQPPSWSEPVGTTAPRDLGTSVARWFPIDVGGVSRGWLKLSVASDGVISGNIGVGPAARVAGSNIAPSTMSNQIVGHYAPSAGTLALVRLGPVSGGRPAPLEALTGVLQSASPISGAVHPLSIGAGSSQTWAQTAASRKFKWLRASGCLSIAGDAVTADAAVQILRDCSAPDLSLNWAFLGIETGASPKYVLVSAHGLCATATAADPFWVQRPCFETDRQDLVIHGFKLVGNSVQQTEGINLQDIPTFDAVSFLFSDGAAQSAPGASTGSYPSLLKFSDPRDDRAKWVPP